jgi:hypothetical protein
MFDEEAIAAWRNTESATGPGAPSRYADLAIECALVFKAVYPLSLRAARGFLSSVVELMHLTLPIPDYSTVSRRQGALQVRESLAPRSGSSRVSIDATGLQVYGAGKWRVWKHRVGHRRTLEQGATYFDLKAPTKDVFRARGYWVAGPNNWYVAKSDTDYRLWNRLVGVTNTERLETGEGQQAVRDRKNKRSCQQRIVKRERMRTTQRWR